MTQSCLTDSLLLPARSVFAVLCIAITACVSLGKSTLDTVIQVTHKDRDGTTEEHWKSLASTLEAAKDFNDLSGCGAEQKIVIELKKWSSRITSELKAVDTLQRAIDHGGWLNKGVVQGQYDLYQSSADIEIKPVESALMECRKTEIPGTGLMATQKGRTAVILAHAVLELRTRMQAALATLRTGGKSTATAAGSGGGSGGSGGVSDRVWRDVEAVSSFVPMDKSVAKFTPREFLLQNLKQNAAEFVAANREVAYQKIVAVATAALSLSIEHYDKPGVDKALNQCRELGMLPEFHSTMERAASYLESLNAANAELVRAASVCTVSELNAALAKAEVVRLDSKEVDHCRRLKETLDKLERSMSLLIITELEAGLATASSLQMAENPVLTRARKLFSDIMGCQSLAKQALLSAAQAKTNGVTDEQYAGLQHVLKMANDNWKGLRHLEEFSAIRALLHRFDTECEVVNRLDHALMVGGWLNTGCPSGAYDEYATADSIDADLLHAVLQECQTAAALAHALAAGKDASAHSNGHSHAHGAIGLTPVAPGLMAATSGDRAATSHSHSTSIISMNRHSVLAITAPTNPEALMYTHKGKVAVVLGWAIVALRAAMVRALPNDAPTRIQDFKAWKEVESVLASHGVSINGHAVAAATLAQITPTENGLLGTSTLGAAGSANGTTGSGAGGSGSGSGGDSNSGASIRAGTVSRSATLSGIASLNTTDGAKPSANGTDGSSSGGAGGVTTDPVLAKANSMFTKCGEVAAAVREIQYQYTVRALNDRVRQTVSKSDLPLLIPQLELAKTLGMKAAFNAPIADAEKLITAFTKAKNKLVELAHHTKHGSFFGTSLSSTSDPEKLIAEMESAIKEASAFKYYDGAELKVVSEYRDFLINLVKSCEQAWSGMDDKKMRVVLATAKQHKLVPARSFPLLAAIGDAIALLDDPIKKDEKQFLNMKLKQLESKSSGGAAGSGSGGASGGGGGSGADVLAIQAVKSEIRKLTIAKAAPTGRFEFAYFSELRNPTEWAKQKELISWNPVSWNPAGWTRTGLADQMLVYSEDDIHAPLTRLPMDVQSVSVETKQQTALDVFTVLLQFLQSGDVKLAVKFVRLGVNHKYVRNELYCQLMKQLTKIPPGSGGYARERAWKLMGVAVKFIRPEGDEMDHTVETFLTKYSAQALIDDLHRLVFSPANQIPVLNEHEMVGMLKKIVEPPLAAFENGSKRFN